MSRTTRILLALCSFLITLAIFLPFAPRGFDRHHDSLMLKTAVDLASGQVLYRDSFTQYGALTSFIHAGALKLLGPSLLSLKQATVFFYAVAAAFLVSAWSLVLPLAWTIGVFATWILFAPFYSTDFVLLPWSSVPALAFQSACLLGLIQAYRTSWASRWVFFAGACSALTFWCRTPVGVFLLASLALTLGVRQLVQRAAGRPWTENLIGTAGWMGAGAIVASLPLFLYFSYYRIWGLWFEDTFVWPSKWAGQLGPGPKMFISSLLSYPVGAHLPARELLVHWFWIFAMAGVLGLAVRSQNWRKSMLFALVVSWLGLVIDPEFVLSIRPWAIIVPFALIGSWVLWLWRRRAEASEWNKTGSVALVFVAAVPLCLASWTQYYPVVCFRHMFWALSPQLGFFLWLLWSHARDRRVLAVTLAVLLLPVAVGKVGDISVNLLAPLTEMTGSPSFEGILALPHDSVSVRRMSRAINAYERAHGASPIYINGMDGIPGVLVSDRTNHDPFFVYWNTRKLDSEQVRKRDEYVRSVRPLIAVKEPDLADSDRWQKEFGYTLIIEQSPDYGVLLAPPAKSPAISNAD